MGTKGREGPVRYVASSGVVSRIIAGELVVVPVRSGVGDLNSVFVANETATFIWSLLGAGATSQEIVCSLVERYEVDDAEAASDVEAMLSALCAVGLAEVARPVSDNGDVLGAADAVGRGHG